ncbi:phytanoyl-CoA dioxygenase family protein [Iamia majanohamensis]|uniref:Phytanoyl-CoA dioxygenase family protein n=1 Tax=Iamia majanohamensis TaxID=467976 RepID=A0AAE9Y465_9ACTN|nr:phytanoyl-CoA dioxygenase family protein [Iamia majanohamensis]WCO65884.1 phytanoyl-CoA dioxygenase family protein [Iamia majanohamensis]
MRPSSTAALARRLGRRVGRAPRPALAPGPPTLRRAAADAALRREGYVVVDLVDAGTVERLRDLCVAVHAEPRSGWASDFYTGDPETKRAVHEAIGRELRGAVDRDFVAHASLLHNFVVNWPGPDGGLVLHQHSSVVDERRYRSVVVWCALTPSTEANGTLHVVPRSHLLQRGPRPEQAGSWAEDHEERLLRDHLVSVELEPGQAIVFDNQLLHCSFANTTTSPRLTAVAIVLPTAAEPCYYEAAGPRVRVHRLDPEFFLETQPGQLEWARPEGLELLHEEPWSPLEVGVEDVRSTLPRGTCSHVPA